MFDVNHLCPGCMGKWEDAEKTLSTLWLYMGKD